MQLWTKKILWCALFLVLTTAVVQAGGFNPTIGGLVWSPDGQSLAFVRHNQGVFIVDMDGHEQRLSDEDALDWSPVWMPDGEALVVARQVENQTHLYRVALDGGEPEMLTPDVGWRPEYYAPGGIQPAVAPEGDLIAFLSLREGDDYLSLYTMSADSVEQKRLTTLGTVNAPVWSPDGDRLAFVAFPDDYSGPGDLFTIKRDGSDLQRLTRSGDVSGDDAPAWSPDGTALAFTSYDDQRRVELIGSDGENRRVLWDNAAAPVFAPEGDRLALTTYGGKWGALTILDVEDGSSVTIELPGERAYYEAAWSPDGTALAFVARRFDDPKSEDIIIVQADGSEPRVLVSDKKG